MKFKPQLAQKTAQNQCQNKAESDLVRQFVEICTFLSEYPEQLSWRTRTKPDITTTEGLELLADRYFSAYRRSDFPTPPNTVPDDMVSFIMEKAYGYTAEKCEAIKIEHQHAMGAENCVGNLLERYLNEKLKDHGWSWCCGDFVRAIDFIRREKDGTWTLVQIKNRDNSENSSSGAIRKGTTIQKWFRSFSKDTKRGRKTFTRWEYLPETMQGCDLNEEGFRKFVADYLALEKIKLNSRKAGY